MPVALAAPMLPLRGSRGSAKHTAPLRKPRVGVRYQAEPERYGKREDDVLQVSGDWRQFRYVGRSDAWAMHATGQKAHESTF